MIKVKLTDVDKPKTRAELASVLKHTIRNMSREELEHELYGFAMPVFLEQFTNTAQKSEVISSNLEH